ncbi:MAG: hypothetical protein QOC94_4881, partial [Actinoplanes sp.]|nr:hypothetical protein [Actinoplanes sp.]
MSRMRAFACLVLLAATGLLVPATAAGASSGAGRPTRIGYHIVQIVQSTPDSPRFRGESRG